MLRLPLLHVFQCQQSKSLLKHVWTKLQLPTFKRNLPMPHLMLSLLNPCLLRNILLMQLFHLVLGKEGRRHKEKLEVVV
jgi:hypothetical protein